MSILQQHYYGDGLAKAGSMPVQIDREEMAKREDQARKCHAAQEAIKVLSFLTNPSQGQNPNAIGHYGPLNSDLAQKIADLCIDSLAALKSQDNAHDLSKD